MNKIYIFTGCLLFTFLQGCTPLATKEELLSQAREIKSSAPPEPLKSVISKLSSLPDKEKLVYKAKFFGVSIGKFIISNNGKMIREGKEVYHFELKVETLPFFSAIFKTKDRYVAYMDTQELIVLRHEEYIKGGTLLESAVDFNYKDLTATYKNFINQQESTVKIPDKLLDILSGGFYLRMLPLGLGDTADLNIYADGKIYNLTGLVTSKTKVKLPDSGKQDAYSFKPYLFLNGEQIKKISAELYISTGVPSKPLRATLKALLGNVHVILVEGL